MISQEKFNDYVKVTKDIQDLAEKAKQLNKQKKDLEAEFVRDMKETNKCTVHFEGGSFEISKVQLVKAKKGVKKITYQKEK